MSTKSKIRRVEHEGIVISISPDAYKVLIESRSACATCHAKTLCSASEMERKEIIVKRTAEESESFKVGQRVIVELEESLGLRAAWIVYAPPIVILVAILLYLQHLKLSEGVVGLLAIAGIVIYYLILYIFKARIGRRFYFTIRSAVKDN